MKETIQRTLSCYFSDEEKVNMAKDMAQANVKKAGIEMTLKEDKEADAAADGEQPEDGEKQE